ncbi:MAG TPA: cation:proton antiporter [Gemmatimonadales bacterium]|nr:cation:proton antiporter [Gemmatimonadales bacterium]
MPDAMHHLVQDLALVLCTAALVTVVFHRLHLPVILGYLLAGVLISPHVELTPNVDEGTIRSLADLGVILLMFSLGLGFTLQKLARAASTAGIVAPLEMAASFCLGYLAALLLGYDGLGAAFIGAVFSISSTMVVARTFEELQVRDEVATRAYGILVFEDLVAIALLAGFSAVVATGDVSAGLLWGTMGRLGLFLGILLVGGLFLVPRLARGVVRLRRAETIVVAAAGFAFAFAILAQAAGFSVALGAFLAGALVAESGAGRIVAESVRPLRDVFAAIFFVAVGMLVDPAVVLGAWPAVLLFTLVVVVGKVLGVTVGTVLTGAPVRIAVRTGLSLAQIGEFSFILAGVGVAAGALPDEFLAVTVAVSVLTAGATPVLVRRSERLALWVDRRLPKPLQTWAGLYGSWLEGLRSERGGRRPITRDIRVLLIDAAVLAGIVIAAALSRAWAVAALMRGFDLTARVAGAVVLLLVLAATFPFLLGLLGNGRRLARRLAEQALAPRTVGPDTARSPRTALQRSLEVLIVVLLTAPLVAVTLPFVPVYGGLGILTVVLLTGIVAIWRSAADLRGHVRATAEVVAEALAKQRAGAGSETMEFVRMTLPGIGAPTSCEVPPESPAVGRSLKELNLRGRTGATVVALVRGDQRFPFPDADVRLAARDYVALAGTRNAIEAARLVIETTG